MNYYSFLLKNAFEDFKRNKTRTILASLGITIGVFSVVMLIALGIGLKNYIRQQFENMGSNLVMIMPGNDLSEGGFSSFGSSLATGIRFDERDLNTISRVDNIDYVVPIFMKSMVVTSLEKEELASLMGTNEDLFKLMDLKAVEGRILEGQDISSRSKDVVLGISIAEKLFDDAGNAIGKTVRLGNQRFKVIGVVEKMGDPEMDGGIFMSYKTTFGSINPDKNFFTIYVGVDSEGAIEGVKSDIEEALLKRYEEDEFSVSEQSELLDVVNQIFGMINSVLVAIGSISLIVGGIGIMNIMYANVTERTKEIGIRRAIGATKKDILVQFVAESVLLSGLGGIMGLVASALIVLVVRPFFPVALNFLAVFAAIGISSFIGVFFGVFPARRAANLTPIEAIRYE